MTGDSTLSQVPFAGNTFVLPEGWREVKRETDRLTLRSAAGNEQATITTLALPEAPSMEEFERLCAQRLEAERRVLRDGFANPSAPRGQTFVFVGGDKATRRIFSGYMRADGPTLLTIYLESIGVAPQQHLATFQAIVSGRRELDSRP